MKEKSYEKNSEVTNRFQKLLLFGLVFLLAMVFDAGTGMAAVCVQADDKVLVTEPLSADPNAYYVTPSSVYIQEPTAYFGSALSNKGEGHSGNHATRNLEGTASDYASIQSYVDRLCSGCNLKLIKKHYVSYSSGSIFFSWGLNYTGSGNVISTTTQNYEENTCNVMIYGFTKKNTLKAYIYIPDEMEQVDLGMRLNGEDDSPHSEGKSALAGLYRLSDGSYQTSDGRLRAKVGSAVVVLDGTEYSCDAEFARDGKMGRDELWVRYYNNGGLMCFFAPKASLSTGSNFSLEDLIWDESFLLSGKLTLGETNVGAYGWTNDFFAASHGGTTLETPLRSNNIYENLTVRLMYWGSNDTEAVYYIGAKFKTAPYSLEALCAVDLNGGEEKLQVDGTYTIQVGEEVSIGCPRSSNYTSEQFKWEITEGSNFVSKSGETGDYCVFTGKAAGTAKVKATYTYSYRETDPRTGGPFINSAAVEHVWLITVNQKSSSSGETLQNTTGQSTEEKRTTQEPTTQNTTEQNTSNQTSEAQTKFVWKGIVYRIVSGSKVQAVGQEYYLNHGTYPDSLKMIQIPNTVSYNNKSYKVTSVDAGAFRKAPVTSVTIGKNVQKIGEEAFAGCRKLQKVQINSTKLTSIGEKAFYDCRALKSLTVKSKVLKTIGKSAFGNCKKLTALTLKSTKLSKKGTRYSLKNSSLKTIKTSSGLRKAYKKYFAKSNSGKTVKIQ